MAVCKPWTETLLPRWFLSPSIYVDHTALWTDGLENLYTTVSCDHEPSQSCFVGLYAILSRQHGRPQRWTVPTCERIWTDAVIKLSWGGRHGSLVPRWSAFFISLLFAITVSLKTKHTPFQSLSPLLLRLRSLPKVISFMKKWIERVSRDLSDMWLKWLQVQSESLGVCLIFSWSAYWLTRWITTESRPRWT